VASGAFARFFAFQSALRLQNAQDEFPDVQVEGNVEGVDPRCAPQQRSAAQEA